MSADSKMVERSALRPLMAVLFIGVFMAALDTAVIGPAIPALRTAFGVDNRQVGLVTIVFVLFSLCSTALTTNLSDRYGRRPIYLFSVGCFALGSLLTALSPRFSLVVASRAVQGVGAGGIAPTASAVIGDVFTPAERGKALGLIGATYGMAFVMGPPLAALLLVVAGWRWIFLLNVPIAVVVMVLAVRALPRAVGAGVGLPIDRAGMVVTFLLLGCLVLGITRAADDWMGVLLWPWMLGAVALLLGLLVRIEGRAPQPMISLRLFSNRQLAIVYWLALGVGFGMGGIIFVASIAAVAYAVPANRVGFVLLPLVVFSMVGSAGAGRLLNRLGARSLLLWGFGLLAVGYAALSITRFGLTAYIAASIPVGLGLGVVVGGPLRSIAIDEAPAAVRGAAQGLINICNATGTLVATAAVGAIADLRGGIAGFSSAYRVVGVVMLAAMILSMRLRPADAARREPV
jgi:MFS family permease